MNNELYHYGILGMKWGIRRYQNEDGSLTEAGRRRLADRQSEINKTIVKLKTSDTIEKQARAQKKLYRLVGNYTSLINKIAYNRMSDEEVIEAIRNYKFNDSFPSLVTKSNISAGLHDVKDHRIGLLGIRPVVAAYKGDSEYMQNLGKMGEGIKGAASGATAVIDLMTSIKKFKNRNGE